MVTTVPVEREMSSASGLCRWIPPTFATRLTPMSVPILSPFYSFCYVLIFVYKKTCDEPHNAQPENSWVWSKCQSSNINNTNKRCGTAYKLWSCICQRWVFLQIVTAGSKFIWLWYSSERCRADSSRRLCNRSKARWPTSARSWAVGDLHKLSDISQVFTLREGEGTEREREERERKGTGGTAHFSQIPGLAPDSESDIESVSSAVSVVHCTVSSA